MFLTLNDLSINNSVDSEHSAKKLIDDFVVFCKSLSANSIVDEIIFPVSLFSEPLYNSYGLAQWLTDNNIPTKHRQFFRRFLDKHRIYYNQQDVDGEFSVKIDGCKYNSIGCTFALEHENILLSLSTNVFWENKLISGEYSSLDVSGEMQTSVQYIDNIWTKMSQEEIIDTYRKELADDITSGQDLWEKREKIYPNLVFCENTKAQLFEDSEKHHIFAIMKKLQRMQEYFSTCGNAYNPKDLGLDARTESDTVKSDSDLKDLRKFRLPNGEEKYFYDHIGFTGKYKGGRIHFLPDNINNKCYIGYIGKHLPTQKY